MIPSNQSESGFFCRALTALVTVAPLILVIASAGLADGQRGPLIVDGLEAVLAVAGVSLVLRGLYALRVRRSMKASSDGKYSVTA